MGAGPFGVPTAGRRTEQGSMNLHLSHYVVKSGNRFSLGGLFECW